MTIDEKDNNKFTWGDSVVIKKTAPYSFHPGEFASVCGFRKISYVLKKSWQGHA